MADVDVLKEELEETKLHLQKAAEFGSALLEKNQALEVEFEALRQRLEARDAEIEQIRVNLDEQSHINRLLKHQMEEAAQSRSVNEKDFEKKYKGLKLKSQTAKEQIKELTGANEVLSEDIEEKKSVIVKYRGIDKELLQYREENEKYVTRLEELQNSVEDLTTEKTELKRELLSLKGKLSKSDESYDALQLENSELLLQMKQKGSSEKSKSIQLISQLEQAETTIESLEKSIGDIKYEKKQLEKTVTDFAIQNQQLHKERDEYLHFLEEARQSLSSFRKKEEEQELEASSIVEGGNDFGNSLLGELEHELESRIGAEGAPVIAPPPDAPENCEEFFFLAATAIKIAFAVQAPKTSDGCFRINIKSLYQQALQAEVPFHEWYDWIKLQLASKQQALQTSVTSSPNSQVNRVRIQKKGGTRQTKAKPPPPKKTGWFNW